MLSGGGVVRRGGIPVGDARHDLGLDVGLDGWPGFAFLGCLGGEDLAQVAGFDL